MSQKTKKFGLMFALVGIMLISYTLPLVSGELTYTPASVENVQNGSYPVSRELYLYTDGEPAENSLAADFIAFLLGETGQEIAGAQKFVPLVPEDYTNNGATGTTINIEGSTTNFPIVQAAMENYTATYTGTTITVSGTGSGSGIEQLLEGNIDIAMSSRPMKASEKESLPNWKEYIIAKDGIAIVVNSDNPIEQLTTEEIKLIFNGTINNWKELGGNDQPIVCVNRESTSGTRDFFFENVMEKVDFRNDDQISEKNSNGAIKTEIEGNENAIGYVGLGYITGLKLVKVAESDTTPNYTPAEDDAIDGFLLMPLITAMGIIGILIINKTRRN